MLARMRNSLPTSRVAGVAISATAYLAALAVAVVVVRATGLTEPLARLGLGTLVATVVIFAASVAVDNSSMYDPYWSLQPLAIAAYYLWVAHAAPSGRQVVVTVLVLLYSVRLTSNFYRDWPGLAKEDFRYADFRRRYGRLYWPVSFFGVHLFPTIMVFLGCLPLYVVAGPDGAGSSGTAPGGAGAGGAGLGWLDACAALVTLFAIGLAFVADEQLRKFRHDPGNRGHTMCSGLWAVSRHPNYLGEVTTWWGLWLFALAVGPGWWWTGVGAIAITLMFVFVSVPLMEKRALATRTGYQEYRAETPMLLPGPRRWAAARATSSASPRPPRET
jgi:steroid 5-alpha reductase family enzyme